MYNVIEMKAVCLWCGAANLLSGLECRKCGAPLTEQPKEAHVQIIERGGGEYYKDEVSALEEKIGLTQNVRWVKQVIDEVLPTGEEVYFEFQRNGIITQIKVFFNYEATADDWRIRIEHGPGITLMDRGNAPGYVDVTRRIMDTEILTCPKLILKHNVSAFGRPRKIETTRWIPTGVR